MLIDCNTCVMQRSDACGDCIVTLLLDEVGPAATGRGKVAVSADEMEALGNLAEQGLVPQLRLVPKQAGDSAGIVIPSIAEPNNQASSQASSQASNEEEGERSSVQHQAPKVRSTGESDEKPIDGAGAVGATGTEHEHSRRHESEQAS